MTPKLKLQIHPQALCETDDIGEGTRVWAFAHVLPGAKVGRDCNLCDGVFVEGGVTIGDRVTVKNGVAIYSGVSIADDVFIGPHCAFTNDVFPRSKRYPGKFAETRIERGASVGANATIVAGATLGEYCMIGAGSVVRLDVAPFALVVGNPARQIGWVGVAGDKLQFEPLSNKCETADGMYTLRDGVVTFARR